RAVLAARGVMVIGLRPRAVVVGRSRGLALGIGECSVAGRVVWGGRTEGLLGGCIHRGKRPRAKADCDGKSALACGFSALLSRHPSSKFHFTGIISASRHAVRQKHV